MIIVKKGGKLFKREYVDRKYEESELNEIEYVTVLNDDCEIQEGVTLRDIFTILKKDMPFYRLLIGNWVNEIVEEGLSQNKSTMMLSLDYLYLAWEWDMIIEETNYFNHHFFPALAAYGIVDDSGNKGACGVSMIPVYELIDLPIKLINNAELKKGPKSIKINECGFTLHHILYGIIWELSFYGPPEDRNTQREKLNKILAEIRKDEDVN